jgi:hypothetical protein
MVRKEASIRRCVGSTWPQGGGRSPPLFRTGFPEPGSHVDPNKLHMFGFYLSAPFGATPFYGHPVLFNVLNEPTRGASTCQQLVDPTVEG